ncbi:MAG: preprotein translocase subunit YajC [Gammaproteobacteria bacterium]|jgi:preprotein translocase subunit YajC|nr:preprotein translocase subunit YajC [Gammaproteobacteria bacterium]MDP6537143.1 preprotein translocase subunit YajC [Gammaproteobacteria bacterium]MDP6733108.1 preprotein translocase subunit YajC [Gammaproteobacteria bacterium]|tara:strand:+ start:136 stop:477 length:342 start_codon:yes stop_codon:yes gene_type:complete
MNLPDFLIPTAHAQAAGVAPAPSATYNLFLFGGMFLLFYLILWRPQTKRAKEHRELIGGVSKGDEVMTSGGLLGKVTKVSDDYIAILVAEKVELKVQKSSVSAVLPKGTINQI